MNKRSLSEQEYLAGYNIHDFPVPLVTVDVVIFTVRDQALHVLLVQRAEHPEKGKWALPGGFTDIQADADLEQAAARKLTEKTGVTSPYLEQLETVGNRQRDPRGWSVTIVYFALINSDDIALAQDPLTQWVNVGDPLLAELAFDHSGLFQSALQRLRAKVAYTALPLHLLPDEFTLTDLKDVFEIILEHEVEKSAFRRRIREADIVEPIKGKKRLGANRPAQLYRIKSDKGQFFFTRNLTGPRK